MQGGHLRRTTAWVRPRLLSVFLGGVGFALLLLLWSRMTARLGETRLPPAEHVVRLFFATITSSPDIALQGGGTGGFLPNVYATAKHYVYGTAFGIGLAVATLAAAARYTAVRLAVEPIVGILRTIPPLAVAPFFLLWFGVSSLSQVGLVAFYVFVMLFPPGIAAIERTNPVLLQFAGTLGASKSVVVRSIIMPALVPELTGPIRVAISWSWGLVVVSELLGAPAGLGKLIGGFMSFTATDLVVVAILWILLLAIVSEVLASIAISVLTRWVPRDDS